MFASMFVRLLPDRSLIKTSVRALDLVERTAEKDLVRSEEKIHALEERMDLDRALVYYARETKEAFVMLDSELSECDMEDAKKRLEIVQRFKDALPPKPSMKGYGKRRRLTAPYAPTSGSRPVLV